MMDRGSPLCLIKIFSSVSRKGHIDAIWWYLIEFSARVRTELMQTDGYIYARVIKLSGYPLGLLIQLKLILPFQLRPHFSGGMHRYDGSKERPKIPSAIFSTAGTVSRRDVLQFARVENLHRETIKNSTINITICQTSYYLMRHKNHY